jgi:hypothetical protein
VIPGSRYAKAVMIVVTAIIVIGLVASAVAYPASL